MHAVAAFLALLSVSLIILGLVFFMMAVILQQGWMIQKELWTLQRALKTEPVGGPFTSKGELKPPRATFPADS
jgi:hypothetical protein